MELLEHYILPANTNWLYEEEAMSSIGLTRDIADKVNEIVDMVNELATEDLEWKQVQEGTIRKGILYIKDNLVNTLHDLCNLLEKQGFFDYTVKEYTTELESRIDNLLGTVVEGSTTMDAEIIDARTRYGGETLTCLGELIRVIDKELQDLKASTDVNVVYSDTVSTLKNYDHGGKPYGEYVEMNETYCTIKAHGGVNVGVATSKFDLTYPDNKLYVDIDLNAGTDSNLYLWVAESYADRGASAQLTKLNDGANHIAINPADYDFTIGCVWVVQNGGDPAKSYIYVLESFKVFQNIYMDAGFEGTELADYVLQVRDMIVDQKAAHETIVESVSGQKEVFTDTLSCLTVWEGNELPEWQKDYETNTITFQSWHNDGITTPAITYDADKLLHIEFDLYHSNSFGTITMVLYASDVIGTGGTFKQIEIVTSNGHHHVTVDPANLAVYDGVDLKYIWWIIKCEGAEDIVTDVSNIHIWQNALIDSGLTTSVADNFLKLISSSADKEGVSEYVVAPSGAKYVTQIDDKGSFVNVPVVPSKTLYLGNSLLTGMAASAAGNDYYSLINKAISYSNADHTASKLQSNTWENCTTTSAQNTWVTSTLLPYLTEDIELVIIQLGDNVNTAQKLAVFEYGMKAMLTYIRTHCPKARVVWVGAWYQTAGKMEIMQRACKATGCSFINIWDLNTSANCAAIGDTYLKEDGTTAEITDGGVASHPNDAGHKAIANRVLYYLGIADTEKYYV